MCIRDRSSTHALSPKDLPKRMLVIGMSYDINVSGLRAATRYRGGTELTLQYVGIFKDKRSRLPKAAVQ